MANAITVLQQTLKNTYLQIHDASPTAEIYVLGYPTLFSTEEGGSCDFIQASDVQWLINEEDTLNAGIEAAVNAANQSGGDGLIDFVDESQTFDGHELCSGGTEWLHGFGGFSIVQVLANMVDLGPGENFLGYFHPNVMGQSELAISLHQYPLGDVQFDAVRKGTLGPQPA